MISRKRPEYILKIIIATVFALLCAGTSVAAETLQASERDGDVVTSRFDALYAERGISFDVKPLVTIKLHGVPSFMRDRPEETQPSQNVPVEAENAPTDDAPSKSVPAVASQDIIIPYPDAVKPEIKPPAAPGTQGKMMWPVSGKVSSEFGGKRGKRRTHRGIDLPMPPGTPIVAAMDGVVLDIATAKDKKYRGYGNVVLVDHGNGLVTLYAHCSKLNVRNKQRVKQSDVVAFVGRTGRATTDHVHFEVRKNGVAVNPIPYLAPR